MNYVQKDCVRDKRGCLCEVIPDPKALKGTMPELTLHVIEGVAMNTRRQITNPVLDEATYRRASHALMARNRPRMRRAA